MGKIGEIPVFPIFLSFFVSVVFIFCVSLQHETNYYLNKKLLNMAANNLKERTQRLVAEFCAGNDEAYAELYDMYVQMLFNYGMKLTSDQELLKDCIHDVFVKVYNKRHDKNAINNLCSYLIISLKNRLLDEFRRQTFTTPNEVETYEYRRAADDVEAFRDGCDGVAMRHPYLRMLVEALEERIGGVDGLEVGTAVFA